MEFFTLSPTAVAMLRQAHRRMRTRTADAYRLNAIILLGVDSISKRNTGEFVEHFDGRLVIEAFPRTIIQ